MNFFDTEINAISIITDPVKRYERFFSLIYIYIDGQHSEVVIGLLEKYIREAETENQSGYEGIFYYSLSYIYLSLGNKKLFQECQIKAKEKFPKIKSKSAIAMYHTYESIVCWFEGRRNDGFDCIFKALHEVNDTNYHEVKGWCLFTLATYQFDSNQLGEAEENYNKALELFKQCNAKYGYARTNNGLASIKIKQEKLVEAATILNEIRDIYVYYNKLSGLSRALTDLGVIEAKLGHFPQALELFEHAYKMRIKTANLQGQITSLLEMGQLLISMKKHDEAEQKLLEAATISGKNNFKAKAFRAHELLAQLYKEKGNFETANEHLEKYFNYKTQVLADESTGRLKVLQTQLLAEEASKRAELEMQNNIELRKAYSIIELKNTEILQSIDYAKRIQKTILPGIKTLKNYFQDIFILYRPKDIVAGDFYWMHTVENKIYFAVCDCTGHGVPGAFVSLVCHQALNRAVVEFSLSHPAIILDKVNELVIDAFSRNEQEHELDQVNDGMDAALLMIDFENKTIEWAGANNPLLILDKSGNSAKLIEIKGNKQPIGRFHLVQPFTNHQFPFTPGNNYYMFSDGYSDQFGGPDWKNGGKKFSQKRLRDLILSQETSPISLQEQVFEEAFINWKAGGEQIDDILIAGITL